MVATGIVSISHAGVPLNAASLSECCDSKEAPRDHSHVVMICSKWMLCLPMGVLFVGALVISASLFGVYSRDADLWRRPSVF